MFSSSSIFNESGRVLKKTFDEIRPRIDLSTGEVSLNEILEWKKVMLKNQMPADDKLIKDSKIQIQVEEIAIIQRGNCPLSRRLNTKEVITHLNSMNIKTAADVVNFSYLRGEGAPSALSCVAGAISSSSTTHRDLSNILTVGRIRNYFKDPKVISQGANGAVIVFKFQNDSSDDTQGKAKKSLFLLKAPLNPASAAQRDGTHEAFVGFFALNQLRNIIPNFMYTYAAFRCTPPVLPYSVGAATATPTGAKGSKLIDAWCSLNDPTHTNNVTYTLIENLANTKTGKTLSLKDLIESGGRKTIEEFMSLLAQIVAALGVAWETCEFTHYDLHVENVLVRETNHGPSGNSEVVIEYDLRDEGKTFKIRCGSIATIIDYGMSHVKVGDVHFGHASDALMNFGVLRDRGNSFFDVFKIVCFSISSFQPREREMLYDLLFPFVRGANETEKREEVMKMIEEGSKIRTSFYYDTIYFGNGTESPTFSFSAYLEHINSVCVKAGIKSPIVSEADASSSSRSAMPFSVIEFDKDFNKVKDTLTPLKAAPSRSARRRSGKDKKEVVDDFGMLLDDLDFGAKLEEIVFDEEAAFAKMQVRIDQIVCKINDHLKLTGGVGGKGKYVSILPSSATRKTSLDKAVFSLANTLVIYDYTIQAINLINILINASGRGVLRTKTSEEISEEITKMTKLISETVDDLTADVSKDLESLRRVSLAARLGGKRKLDEVVESYPLISYGYDLLKDLDGKFYGAR